MVFISFLHAEPIRSKESQINYPNQNIHNGALVMVSNTLKCLKEMEKLLVLQDETLTGEFEITFKSPISSKPSAPRVEGLEADFFNLNA